jgi:hypothetical protein
VPKREIFERLDSPDFYTANPIWEGYLGTEIFKIFFQFWADRGHFIGKNPLGLCTEYAGNIFLLLVRPKKVVIDCFEDYLNVSAYLFKLNFYFFIDDIG